MASAEQAILVIDSGTTSTRAMAFDARGTVLSIARRDIDQHYPRPGWVEHDAAQIWSRTLDAAHEVIATVGGVKRIAAIGLTNQRETVVAWDRQTGQPLYRALVWQDRRTADTCAALRAQGHEELVQQRTGLLLDPYFSATKMRWLLDNVEEVKAAADAGQLAMGTIESWLLYKLTGGLHISDATNASRTSLLPLAKASWDEELCALFGVPRASLPEVVDSHGSLATTLPDLFGASLPITGLAGDQQAATIGQGCLAPGQTKATYGTGAFVLTAMGAKAPRSDHRLLATVLHQAGGERHFALEGSIFVAGSFVQWLRDSLGIIADTQEIEALARSVPDNGGVTIVPALSGLGAPHWLPDARAAITGLSFATARAHVARAALEAMSYQTHDLARAFAGDGAPWKDLRIDGGMSGNDWLAQDLADVLDLNVERPDNVETTALGAAILAAVGCGMFFGLAEAAQAMRGNHRHFTPLLDSGHREERLECWAQALSRL